MRKLSCYMYKQKAPWRVCTSGMCLIPNLRSKVSLSQGESEIWVLPDPKYVQLRELLGHEEAERLS